MVLLVSFLRLKCFVAYHYSDVVFASLSLLMFWHKKRCFHIFHLSSMEETNTEFLSSSTHNLLGFNHTCIFFLLMYYIIPYKVEGMMWKTRKVVVVGWPWLDAKCPPSCSISPLLSWTGKRNTAKALRQTKVDFSPITIMGKRESIRGKKYLLPIKSE